MTYRWEDEGGYAPSERLRRRGRKVNYGGITPPYQPIDEITEFPLIVSSYTGKEYYECPYGSVCIFPPGLVEREPYAIDWIRKHREKHNEWPVTRDN